MNPLSLWVAGGIFLLVLEMLTGTFILIFLSLGFFMAALTHLAGFPDLNIQIIVCATVSIVGAVFLRKPLILRFSKAPTLQRDIGSEVIVEKHVTSFSKTHVKYQGTVWTATNVDSSEIKSGERAIIVGIDGNSLLIKKAN